MSVSAVVTYRLPDVMLLLTFASCQNEVQQKSSALAHNATESELESESKL